MKNYLNIKNNKIKVLIITLIFISFARDHGMRGIMPFEMSIIKNYWTPCIERFAPQRCLITSENEHLVGDDPLPILASFDDTKLH